MACGLNDFFFHNLVVFDDKKINYKLQLIPNSEPVGDVGSTPKYTHRPKDNYRNKPQ